MLKELLKNLILVIAVMVAASLGYGAVSEAWTTGSLSVATSDQSDTLVVSGGILQLPTDGDGVGSLTDSTNMDQAVALRVKGGYAYTGAWVSDSFSIIDVRDPTNPVRVSTLTNATYLSQPVALDVLGDYVYLSNPSDLVIIDVSDPSNPFITGIASEPANSRDVHVAGSFAYTVENNYNLRVFHVADPTNPQEAASVQDTTNLDGAWGLDIDGRFAYVVTATSDRLTIVDISDVNDLSVRGSIRHDYLNDSRDVAVRGNYAYALSFTNNRLTVVNVTDPDNPSILTSLADATYLSAPQNIELAGDYAYVWADGYLTVVDVSDPTSPSILTSVAVGGSSRPASFEIDGNYAYLLSISLDRLTIVDLQGLRGHAASIGSLQTTSLDVLNELDIANTLEVDGGLSVGRQGVSTQGGLSVGGRASGLAPRMYLAKTEGDGDHNCDDDPHGTGCCAPGYHMCDVSEWLLGGREIEMSGADRNDNPYSTYGWTDPKDNDLLTDCEDWLSLSGKETPRGTVCSYTTSLSCTTQTCTSTYGVWCCSD